MLPGVIYEDNDGAIFLSKNKQVGQRTKHIDIRYHFLREFTDKGKNSCGQGQMLKVKGKENYADLLTKNVDGTTFEYLGNDVDDGLKRFRDEIYEEQISDQLGGISRWVKYEVDNDLSPSNKWIKYIKENKESKYVRENNHVK